MPGAGAVQIGSNPPTALPTIPYQRTLVALAAGMLIALTLAVWLVHDEGPFLLEQARAARTWTLAMLGAIPAPLYFCAFCLLPAVGMPMSFFYVTALAVLGGAGRVPGVLLAWTAIITNLLLSYAIARHLFRPLLQRLLRRWGYTIPTIRRDHEWRIILLLRSSPLPFAIQNYTLALADARLLPFMLVSFGIQALLGTSVMVAGDALLHGRLGAGLLAVFVALLLVMLLPQLRKRLKKRSATAS
jgi:uncharacterized membrane protein YdjX (TVP38/TMEM64 family)